MKQAEGTRLCTAEVQALWSAYHDSGDARLRDRLVLTLAPMVRYIVHRKARELPARCEVEDFISCGLEALIRSIDRYDPGRGATLEQFAWTRIHGAVLDELRRCDWAPRSLRRWERDISLARDRFTALCARRPTTAELSHVMGISEPELRRRLGDIARSDVSSLNVLVRGEDETSVECVDTLASADDDADPEHQALRGRAVERFRQAFATLSPRDRTVAILLYVENLTLHQTGQVLGVSESRVCQIHSQLKRRLRQQLRAEEHLFKEVA